MPQHRIDIEYMIIFKFKIMIIFKFKRIYHIKLHRFLARPQVLPVNDTSVYCSWWDSYPYSTASVLALHPQYLALDSLAATLPAGISKQVGQWGGGGGAEWLCWMVCVACVSCGGSQSALHPSRAVHCRHPP